MYILAHGPVHGEVHLSMLKVRDTGMFKTVCDREETGRKGREVETGRKARDTQFISGGGPNLFCSVSGLHLMTENGTVGLT